ncbi:hypothetical protein ACN4EG_25045 [Alkalinema pantanalense CENA528]|uniref:hypothetical protein n=1 Tax=Alkalinema pantanalense TaxID=1620705 RepID=UPI003D6E28E9
MENTARSLIMTSRELEKLCGKEVNDLFVGGICRPSVFRSGQKMLAFLVLELAVAGILLIFSLVISLGCFRGVQDLSQGANAIAFVGLTVGLMLLGLLGWNLWMVLARQPLRMLMRLLDEVDRYNELVQTIEVMDQIQAITPSPERNHDRTVVLTAVELTRDSLVSGLMMERLLRENRGLLARQQDLLLHLEHNGAHLTVLELHDRAQGYADMMQSAIEIGQFVRAEMQQAVYESAKD